MNIFPDTTQQPPVIPTTLVWPPAADQIEHHPAIAELVKLATLPHYECEDSWYSCPRSGDGRYDESVADCTCGADEHNAKVQKLAELLLGVQEEERV